MTSLPSRAAITYDPGDPAGPWTAAVKQLYDFVTEGIAAQVATSLTIASGSITPTQGAHVIDTEGAAASDDLTSIATTNIPDGRWIILRPVSAARVVTLKHAAGGAGQVSLLTGADYAWSNAADFIVLERNGADWREVWRRTVVTTTPDASTTVKGIVELATDAETQTGTDAVRAVTPASGAASYPRLGAVSTYTQQQYFGAAALTDGATISWNLSTAQVADLTLGAAGRTMGAPSNIRDGACYLLRVRQDATGNRTITTWNAAFDFGADGAPTLTTTASKIDYLSFVGRGTTKLDFLGIKKGFT